MENLKTPDALKQNRRSYWITISVMIVMGFVAGIVGSRIDQWWIRTLTEGAIVVTACLVARSWWRAYVFSIYEEMKRWTW